MLGPCFRVYRPVWGLYDKAGRPYLGDLCFEKWPCIVCIWAVQPRALGSGSFMYKARSSTVDLLLPEGLIQHAEASH